MARVTPYAYRCGTSLIHRLPAGRKLGLLLAVSLASFTFGTPALIAAAAAVIAASLVARIPPRVLFAGSRPLLVATLLVVALRAIAVVPGKGAAIDYYGLREGLLFGLSVLVAFAGGAVLFTTTTSAQLREAVAAAEEALTSPFARFLRRMPSPRCRRAASRLERSSLSLVFALTLGFLPRVFEAWEAAEDARAARCGKRGPIGMAAVVPLVLERLMETAAETARAMEARGATLGREGPFSEMNQKGTETRRKQALQRNR